MRRFAILALTWSWLAAAQTVPTLHLNASVMPFSGGYALNGGIAPPSTGYQVGATLLHLDVRGDVLDLSLNGLAALSAFDVSSGVAIGISDPQAHGAGFSLGVVARAFVFGQGFTWAHFQPGNDLRVLLAVNFALPNFHRPDRGLLTFGQPLGPEPQVAGTPPPSAH